MKAATLRAFVEGGKVLIESAIPHGDRLRGMGDIAVYLSNGESFGGRSFAEWASLANGPGEVSADWLEV